MDIISEYKIANKTDDPGTILKLNLEETVGEDFGSVIVTKTVVEKTEVSVVKIVEQKDESNKGTGNEKEGHFGNLVDENEGLKVKCSENGKSVDGSLAGENGSCEFSAPMVICSSEGNKKSGDNAAKGVELEIDINKKDEENVEKELADDHDEEQEEDHNHNFVVGDFVWGKIKSHPWWPGQIYDPNDASDYAASLKRKGRILVAFFGDGSFSWCSPSQLKPFVDDFQEMCKQSDSKKFVHAVQEALEEVGRRVEAELMCKCKTFDGNGNENAGVVNRGIKEGTHVPKGNTIKVLMDLIEPVELVSTLKGYATMEIESGARPVDLELLLLKIVLSGFYSKKSGHLLADYHEPMCIEGLEEETNGVVADGDATGPSESAENGDDKLYQTRKQKSVAELLGEDETKLKKVKRAKDGGMKKDRRRKALVVSVTPETEHETGGGGFEEESMSPRQRKKSRYLSPPYLSPVGSGRLSVLGSGTGSGSFKEPKTVEQFEDSLKKSSGRKTREKRRLSEGSDSQEHKKTDAVVNVTDVLDALLCAALDPSAFVEKEKNLPTITELVSSFRSSMFKEAAGDKTDKKKNGEDIAFVKQKLEWMNEMVQMCGESEMNADVKASLQGGIQEVLEKVVTMRGK